MTDATKAPPGLTREQLRRALPRRFYAEVAVTAENTIVLDKKTLRTPLKAVLQPPVKGLAEAIAAEWHQQVQVIDPATMPVTKYVNTVIDRANREKPAILSEIVGFAGSDLVCYRAEKPAALVALQAQAWDPVVDWANKQWRTGFLVTTGISHVSQPANALDAVRQWADRLDPYRLTVLHNLTTLTGSALLAARITADAMSFADAWAAAHVDEDFQIKEWGADDEATARRAARKVEYDGLTKILALLQGWH